MYKHCKLKFYDLQHQRIHFNFYLNKHGHNANKKTFKSPTHFSIALVDIGLVTIIIFYENFTSFARHNYFIVSVLDDNYFIMYIKFTINDLMSMKKYIKLIFCFFQDLFEIAKREGVQETSSINICAFQNCKMKMLALTKYT